MSRIEAQRRWMDRVNGPSATTVDDATLDRLERRLRHVEPDPLFKRRLRSEVVNRYVAQREGHLREPRRRREMGKLGRAALYASLGVALSVSAAGAASQQALPGDILYPMKRQLEEIRIRVAPEEMRDDLAAMALDERLDELETLAERGDWGAVARASAAVTAAEHRVEAYGGQVSATVTDAIEQHIAVLQALMAEAPASAQAGLQHAVEVSQAAGNAAAPHDGGARPDGRDHPAGQPPAPAGDGTGSQNGAGEGHPGRDATETDAHGAGPGGRGHQSPDPSAAPSPPDHPTPSTEPNHP